MLSTLTIRDLAHRYLSHDKDREFCERVWATPDEKYTNRLLNIGFNNMADVLDAGSGLGQWTVALRKLNKHVKTIEVQKDRLEFTKAAATELGIGNIEFFHGSIENLPFDDQSLDGIFSYSVILFTDYRKTLKEFHRVLRPGGKLYFNTNGMGWYIYNLIDQHNSTSSFSSRQMAIDAMQNTIRYYASGEYTPGHGIIMPKELILGELPGYGFEVVAEGDEGTINLTPGIEINPFFKGKYYNMDGVYEVLCRKKG
jgi:ubiquinone/menaquinone biosynthesis C-methylase UbiE